MITTRGVLIGSILVSGVAGGAYASSVPTPDSCPTPTVVLVDSQPLLTTDGWIPLVETPDLADVRGQIAMVGSPGILFPPLTVDVPTRVKRILGGYLRIEDTGGSRRVQLSPFVVPDTVEVSHPRILQSADGEHAAVVFSPINDSIRAWSNALTVAPLELGGVGELRRLPPRPNNHRWIGINVSFPRRAGDPLTALAAAPGADGSMVIALDPTGAVALREFRSLAYSYPWLIDSAPDGGTKYLLSASYSELPGANLAVMPFNVQDPGESPFTPVDSTWPTMLHYPVAAWLGSSRLLAVGAAQTSSQPSEPNAFVSYVAPGNAWTAPRRAVIPLPGQMHYLDVVSFDDVAVFMTTMRRGIDGEIWFFCQTADGLRECGRIPTGGMPIGAIRVLARDADEALVAWAVQPVTDSEAGIPQTHVGWMRLSCAASSAK